MEATKAAKILIVDDQIHVLQAIRRVFEQAETKYEVSVAPNGAVALQLMEKQLPDLVISDWEMPQLSGIEFVQALHKSERTRHIPVIMCTGIMTSSANLKTALDAGAYDYVRKPIDEVELLARANAALTLAQSRKEVFYQNKMLEDHIATKDRLFSIIAHDLRSPFVGILGLGELAIQAIREGKYEGMEEMLETAFDSVRSGYKLLENLLEWAKVQIGSFRLKTTQLDLKEVIDQSISVVAQQAANKGIELSNTVEQPLRINADPNMLTSIIRNLLSNAVKFTHPDGEVRVEAGQEGQTVWFAVVDNGVGMSQEQTDSLFDSATNASTYGTDYERGTGLGLVLCHEFVAMHQGRINIESKIGQGSRFQVVLPIRQPD